MKISLRAPSLFAICAALAACTPTSADGANVQTGAWAGEHIVMQVTGAGATVEFDCAHATIDAPLVLDSGGRFDLAGSFTPEGGPERGDQSRTVAARFGGVIRDSTLTLTVVLTENTETIGVFTLRHGAQARLFKCK